MATAAATNQGALPKVNARPKYLAFAFIALMMAYVLVHNESYLWNSGDPIWSHYRDIKWYLLPHGLAAACALLLGPMQFSDRLRLKYAKFHRVMGRLYVGGALIGGPMGAVMQAVEGPVQWTTLSVVDAAMWVGTTFIALLFILKRNVTQHRNWMTRSYAIAIVFLEGRFFGGLTGLDQPGNDAMLLAIVWTCLALSVPIADVGIHLQELMRKRQIARAAAA
jgi:Predicted membrane protein (DUF2306)